MLRRLVPRRRRRGPRLRRRPHPLARLLFCPRRCPRRRRRRRPVFLLVLVSDFWNLCPRRQAFEIAGAILGRPAASGVLHLPLLMSKEKGTAEQNWNLALACLLAGLRGQIQVVCRTCHTSADRYSTK